MSVTTPHFRDDVAREFHVSRRAREAYGMPDTLFALNGNVIFADFHSARIFAHRMNSRRDLLRFPEQAVSAGHIYALGLIDEVLHLVVARHRRDRAPQLMADALTVLEQELGGGALQRLLETFVGEFPPTVVYRGEVAPTAFLETAANREATLEELLLLWLANRNPAFASFRELFDDEKLQRDTAYPRAMDRLETILDTEPASGGSGESLLAMLYAPMRASPHSLEGQLEFIRSRWAQLIGPDLYRILGGLDLLAEERRVVFPPGPGPVEAPDYAAIREEEENYSPDREWMPRLVLQAKNAYVWLAQLSEKYGREITTLDGVPDEELATLATRGMSGLWLIGVWERSRASERIKKMMGDEDAVASAYSLLDYRIADDLGGEEAFSDLRDCAWRHGIRLSTDMVPNHMGIDSRWVIEHPDWFLSLGHPPFPAYSFNGPDLSDDGRVGIFIEDHYWEKSDAAVVFKRVDRETGDERYIYHGNDGTSMPWNDTAQLDYLKAEVREAVIQTILSVARRSPVIRFDAAMTLARQHYQRLWFPEPGSGGDIPSRAEFALTRAQFETLMPREFWREVVDRVAKEAPDTLLLAEAFWLLEGYFVRSLGMHRVYNSAFMNMLRDERNAEYRKLIRSTLEFDPQILKRYVNFMSNPDERTAIDQFGDGDKYFGVATLLATLPGLPMFGHGQIEGLGEKYGMEFRRPRWHETPNEGLVRRHEHQIFPLLRRRSSFAEVENFLLYDFVTGDGSVDENVFAFSNLEEGQRSLVVYHNRFGDTRGRIRSSTGVMRRDPDGSRHCVQRSLAEGLGLTQSEDAWLAFRDAVSGLEYLRSCAELRSEGLFVELGAYHLHVFVDFRELREEEHRPLKQLAAHLGGRGVPSVEDALGRWVMSPVLAPFRRLLRPAETEKAAGVGLASTSAADLEAFLKAVAARCGGADRVEMVGEAVSAELNAALGLSELVPTWREEGGAEMKEVADALAEILADTKRRLALRAWILVHRLGELAGADDALERARSWLGEWFLGATLADLLVEGGAGAEEARRAAAAVDLMIACEGWTAESAGGLRFHRVLEKLFASPAGQRFLGVHRHREVLWFNREAFHQMLDWLLLERSLEEVEGARAEAAAGLNAAHQELEELAAAGEESGWRVDDFLDAIQAERNGRDAR